jgi:hypothetical protein
MVVELLAKKAIGLLGGEIFNLYKEKIVTKNLKKLLFKPEEYELELNALIIDSIDKYEKEYPPTGKYPFYHHKETFLKLSEFILFESDKTNILQPINYNNIPEIDKPSEEQLNHFYNYFIDQVKANRVLNDLYVNENYKGKIFDIYKEISSIKNTITEYLSNIPESETIIKKWCEQIYDNLKNLKSVTALLEIESFEKEIMSANNLSDKNRAFVYFIKGSCLNENGKPKEAIDYFNQANVLDPTNSSYRTWFLYLQFLFNRTPEVDEEINTHLNKNVFDPILNGIIAMQISDPFSNKIPQSVKKNIRFKRFMYRHNLSQNNVEVALSVFENDDTNIEEELKNINLDNYSYLDFYLQLFLIKMLRKFPNNNLLFINPALKESPDLTTCIEYFKTYVNFLKGTEKQKLQHLFDYLLHVLLFIKEENIEYLNHALKIYDEIKDIAGAFYYNLLKISFSQAKEYQKSLELFQESSTKEPEEYFYLSFLYYKLGNNEKRRESVIGYINNTDDIDDENIDAITAAILNEDILYSDIELFYDKLADGRISLDGICRDVLIATKGAKEESLKGSSIQLLKNNFEKIKESQSLKIVIAYCKILHSFKEWSWLVEILGNRQLNYYDEKALLIDSLYYSKINPILLMELLEGTRTVSKYEPYLLWEIELNTMLNEWEKVELISREGKEHFPKNRSFVYYLAIAYSNQLKKNEFKKELKNIDLKAYPLINFKVIIHGLITNLLEADAIETAYQYAIDNPEPLNKSFFFELFVQLGNRTNYFVPIYCEDGYYIVIKNDKKNQVIDAIFHKAIFSKLIGKKVNDIIEIEDKTIRKNIQYTITAIRHKYEILMDKIQQEAEDSELTGLPIKSFLLNGNSIEDWNKQLMEMFGSDGDEREVFIDKTISQYKLGQISFLQLVRNLFKDDAIEAFLACMQAKNLGLKVLPLGAFNKINVIENKAFCLDISSIMLLYKMQQEFGISHDSKFLTSTHSLDYFNELLFIKQNQKDSNLTLQINSRGVFPIARPQEEIDYKKEFLHGVISWISENCELKTSKEKLRFMIVADDEQPITNIVASYLDTICLCIDYNSILVSDEIISYKTLNPQGLVISSEYFLKSKIDDVKLFNYLLKNNFTGISIPFSEVPNVYKSISESLEDSEKLLANMSFKNIISSTNVVVLVMVSIEIYNKESQEERRIELLNKLFENFFINLYPDTSMLQSVLDLVRITMYGCLMTEMKKYEYIQNIIVTILKKNGIEVNI